MYCHSFDNDHSTNLKLPVDIVIKIDIKLVNLSKVQIRKILFQSNYFVALLVACFLAVIRTRERTYSNICYRVCFHLMSHNDVSREDQRKECIACTFKQ